jgi:hypothetical protein
LGQDNQRWRTGHIFIEISLAKRSLILGNEDIIASLLVLIAVEIVNVVELVQELHSWEADIVPHLLPNIEPSL